MKFKNKFAHKSNYGSARPLSNIKYIVIHFTGNKGDTALNNCKYFQSANRHASAHCFVDGSGTVEMIIHRLTGDGKRDELVGPMWSLKKWEVLNDIDRTLKERDTYQGIYYKK